MKPLTLPRVPLVDHALVCWVAWAQSWGVSGRLAQRVWAGVARSQHPDAQLLRFRLGAVWQAHSRRAQKERLLRLAEEPLTPARIIALIENGVSCGWITREDATEVEQAILDDTDVSGVCSGYV